MKEDDVTKKQVGVENPDKAFENDEQLDFADLENVEGGGVIVVGCGKGNGNCSISQKQLEALGDQVEVN